MIESYKRSLEDTKELLYCAKLDDSFSSGPVQIISLDDQLHSEDYKILEVTEDLAKHLCEAGSKCVLELKEEPNKSSSVGRTFALTKDKCYSILEAETSNCLLLASDWWLPSNQTVQSDKTLLRTTVNVVKSSYYELQPCIAPSLPLLKNILKPSMYQGPSQEEDDDVDDNGQDSTSHRLYSFSDLLQLLPCTESQLQQALKRLHAVQLDGYIRLVDQDYLYAVIKEIFACADENAWNWRVQGFPRQTLVDNLCGIHSTELVEHILTSLFAERSDSRFFTNDRFVFPKTSLICGLIGEQILSVANSSFDLTDFLAVWKATVPDGLKPKLRKHLTCAGRAFCYLSAIPKSIDGPRFHSVSLLRSEDVTDESVEKRLSALFEKSQIWPETELASYLTELLVDPSEQTNTPTTPVSPDSDFEYEDIVDIDSTDQSNSDSSSTIPAAISSTLTRLCRVTNTKIGRFCTEKHARN